MSTSIRSVGPDRRRLRESNDGMPAARPYRIVVQGASAMAAAMGVGRFAYTPILPLMHAQAGLSPQLGSALATANYAGYLAGALAGIAVPALTRSKIILRVSLVLVTVTLALMPATHAGPAWVTLRLVAGAASALVFVIAAGTLISTLRQHADHLTGWGFGGVGAGIALSGLLVLALPGTGTWRQAWWLVAALSLALTIPAWHLPTDTAERAARPARPVPSASPGATHGTAARRARRWPPGFAALLTSYGLEGVGYIIAGTFLVVAIDQSAARWVGTSAWVLAGLAALPSAALWSGLARRWSRPTLLTAALALQAVGIALPALVGGVGPALLSAVLFGATFLGIATLALAIGAQTGTPRAVAILTAAYSAGQIAGPILVTPLLHTGYHQALLAGAVIVVLAAVAAGLLRARAAQRLTFPEPAPATEQRRPALPAEPDQEGE
jgi:MFS family permease